MVLWDKFATLIVTNIVVYDNKYTKIKYININKKHIKNKLNVFFLVDNSNYRIDKLTLN